MRKFLNTCIAIEETIAAVYRHLAETVCCDDELKGIWRKMADEEDQHATQIRFAARLPHKDTFRGERLTQGKAEQILNRAKTILNGVQSATITAEDALRVSAKLEGEFRQVHIASAVEFIDEKMKEMFQRLAHDDEQHEKALNAYNAKHFEKLVAATQPGS